MAVHPVHGLSLCAGGGGLDLGLDIAIPEYRTVCYVEREAYAASVIVARMAEKALPQAPIWDDITTFDGKPWRGVIHLISAGDPCQPWSHAGQRKGYDDERVVFDDVARIVGEVHPEFVFLENVPGAIEFRAGCKRELESMGYRVEAGLFSAAEVGAPHGRLRIFLLGHLADPRQGSVFISPPSETNGEDRGTTTGAGTELQHAPYDSAIEGVSVADTHGTGQILERRGDVSGNSDSPHRGHADRCDLPLFPPRPNDLAAWREVLEVRPDLEPAVAYGKSGGLQSSGAEITDGGSDPREELGGRSRGTLGAGQETQSPVCGVADGTSYRVERLQLLGNAVVPLTAALAFATLFERLIHDEQGGER